MMVETGERWGGLATCDRADGGSPSVALSHHRTHDEKPSQPLIHWLRRRPWPAVRKTLNWRSVALDRAWERWDTKLPSYATYWYEESNYEALS